VVHYFHMPPLRTEIAINGDALRAFRELQGRSVRGLAQEAGVDYSYLSKLERGVKANASPETAQALADVLVVPLTAITTKRVA
jgi:transcriptional regulator with XRE-family HTH domain